MPPAKKSVKKRRPRIKRPPPMLPESTWGAEAMTIILRIPPKSLSPNGRTHWASKQKVTREARGQAKLTTLNLLRGHEPPKPIAYSIHYYWPATHRDDDNAIASCKAYMDGICEALRMDDRNIRFRTLTHDSDKLKPRLEITLHFDP